MYLIKIKSVLANVGSEKKFKVQKVYFITTEIDLIEEKKTILTNTPILNKSKVKFLRTKQDSIR